MARDEEIARQLSRVINRRNGNDLPQGVRLDPQELYEAELAILTEERNIIYRRVRT